MKNINNLADILNIYEDRNHVKYIAYKESQFSTEDLNWFYNLQNSMSLDELVKQFPYVVLVYDNDTGSVVEKYPCEYNGALTNNFHIAYAKYLDKKAQNEEKDTYSLNIKSIYNNKPDSQASIGFNEDNIIQNPNEGFIIDNDKIPDKIEIAPLPKNYHPNKDANGNYMAGPIQQYQQQFVYNPSSTYIPSAYPQYINQYRTYNNDPTDINRHIIRF